MSDIHAHARAREAAGRHIDRLLGKGTSPEVIGQMAWDRDGLVDLFAAGWLAAEARCAEIHGAEQEQWAEERQIGQRQLDDATALMSEAAELFREYERHHKAKASEAGRPEKAYRNALMAARLEAWLRGDGIYPITADGAYGAHAGFRSVPNAVVIHRQSAGQTTEALAANPAEVLRDIAEGMVDGETIRGVDHASFDQASDQLARPVPWRTEGVADLVAVRLNTGDPRFDPAFPATINGFLYVPAKENEHG